MPLWPKWQLPKVIYNLVWKGRLNFWIIEKACIKDKAQGPWTVSSTLPKIKTNLQDIYIGKERKRKAQATCKQRENLQLPGLPCSIDKWS